MLLRIAIVSFNSYKVPIINILQLIHSTFGGYLGSLSQTGNWHWYHVYVYVLCCFITCVDLCNHCCSQDTELFHHHKYLPHAAPFIVILTPFLLTISKPWKPLIYLYFCHFKELYSMWSFEISLPTPSILPLWPIHVVCVNSSFLSVAEGSILWHGWASLFNCAPVVGHFVSGFGLSQIKLVWSILHRFLWAFHTNTVICVWHWPAVVGKCHLL